MGIRPLYDRIVVRRDKEEDVINGIILPDAAKERPQRGTVIAVGTGKRCDDGTMIPLDLKVGDAVLFGKYSGADVEIEGGKVLIMREDEVLARLREV